MHKVDKKEKQMGVEHIIPVREMLTLYSDQETGMDCKIAFRDEDDSIPLLCDADLFGPGFTANGRITSRGLNRFLEKASEKHRVEVAVLCVRRVR